MGVQLIHPKMGVQLIHPKMGVQLIHLQLIHLSRSFHQEQLARKNGFANWQAFIDHEKKLKAFKKLPISRRLNRPSQTVRNAMAKPVMFTIRRLENRIANMKRLDLTTGVSGEVEKTQSSFLKRLEHANHQARQLKLK